MSCSTVKTSRKDMIRLGTLKAALIALAVFLATAFILPPAGDAAPKVKADAAVLMDLSSGRILYDKNGSKRRSPASLTKIMTALIALEYGHREEVVTVSPQAAAVSTGSAIGLEKGDRLTLGNLLVAALMYSANDSAVAIAEHIAGNHDAFIRLMNKKALAMGALHTRFANTNGYSNPNHYSTARDLARITRYALKNKTFNRIVKNRHATVMWLNPVKEREIKNTNKLLTENRYPGIDGVKTGTAVRAGQCLTASATRDGRRLVAVILHSPARYEDAIKLFDYGFSGMEEQIFCSQGEVVTQVPVREGVVSRVSGVAREEVRIFVDGAKPPVIEKKVILSKEVFSPGLVAPVKKGEVIGKVVYRTEAGEELAWVDLVAAQDVRRLLWPERLWRHVFPAGKN